MAEFIFDRCSSFRVPVHVRFVPGAIEVLAQKHDRPLADIATRLAVSTAREQRRGLPLPVDHATLRKVGRKDGKGGVSDRTVKHALRLLSKALKDAARIDLEAKKLKVEETLESTKTGLRTKAPKTKRSRREITLPDLLVEILREHRRVQMEWWLKIGAGRMPADALVFPNELGEFDSPRALSKAWRDFADRHGMEGMPLHGLRHTHASMLIDAGIDVVMVSRRLGHASPAITLRVYAHLFQPGNDRAAAAINAFASGSTT